MCCPATMAWCSSPSWVRARSLARCCCRTSSVDRCSRCAATLAPTIPCSQAAREAGSPRAVHGMVKRTAARAGVNAAISPHWLRHAHGSHAIDEGAKLHEVKATLGHANVSTTRGYLHARPGSSSGLKLDPGVFLQNDDD